MLKREPQAKPIPVGTGVYEPGKASTTKGSHTVTVKGKAASASQKTGISECCTEALSLGASKRVLIAIVMCVTQETDGCDPKLMSKGPVAGSRGPFEQIGAWGPLADRMSYRRSTRMFLLGGQGGQPGWKQLFGSLKNAPGDLGEDVQAIQKSAYPSLYSQWEAEATRTVEDWLGGYVTAKRLIVEPYEFTRGERNGHRENSWDCSGRLAEEVDWRRWAQHNTLFFEDEEELRAAAPSLTIDGTESWLLTTSQIKWVPSRAANQVTIKVLADSWALDIGSVVYLEIPGPVEGRWLVSETHGGYLNPELEVVLKRPARKLPEPAPTVRAASEATQASLLAACKAIDEEDRAYVYGGGHGVPFKQITPHEGLDCSSSTSLALWKAKMFPGKEAMTSGEIADSWGKPGEGREFTVWANAEHVWIEFRGSSTYKRFDTSPHGDGPSGPHLRKTARTDQSRFTARHWPGS